MLVRYVFDELFHNQRHPTPLHPEFHFTLTARERNAAESHFSLLFVDVDTTESRAYHHERVDAAEAGLEKLKRVLFREKFSPPTDTSSMKFPSWMEQQQREWFSSTRNWAWKFSNFERVRNLMKYRESYWVASSVIPRLCGAD